MDEQQIIDDLKQRLIDYNQANSVGIETIEVDRELDLNTEELPAVIIKVSSVRDVEDWDGAVRDMMTIQAMVISMDKTNLIAMTKHLDKAWLGNDNEQNVIRIADSYTTIEINNDLSDRIYQRDIAYKIITVQEEEEQNDDNN